MNTISPIRTGYWMQTYTGKMFYPADPRPEDICIEDIAHALSIENRFGGHLPEPYSVAQHSVLVSRIAGEMSGGDKVLRMWGLMHDSAEAYVKDIPRPLKKTLGISYSLIEEQVLWAIATKLGLPGIEIPASVKKSDDIALATERRDLFPASLQHNWKLGTDASTVFQVSFKPWYQAKEEFMAEWKELTNG